MKKLRFSKPKRIKKSTLRNKADTLFSKFIRQKGYCELAFFTKVKCGGVLQCMHGVTRGCTAIRYEPMNAWCGCAGHHVWFTNNEHAWEEVMEKHFPDKWAFIEKHKNDTVKKTEDLYKEVIERYKELV